MKAPAEFARGFLEVCQRYEREGLPEAYGGDAESAFDELFPSYLPWGRDEALEAAAEVLREAPPGLFKSIRAKYDYDMVDSLLGFYRDLWVMK